MDLGILVLRLVLAALLWGHATQKLFGWFRGQGRAATAAAFERWGLAPGLPFVVLSGVSELAAGALIVLGLAMPAAVAITVGTMSVAVAYNWERGLWAHLGGFEVALVYALIAVVLGLTGPGAYALDSVAGLPAWHGPAWVLGSILAGLAGAAGPITLRARAARRASAAGATGAAQG